MKKDYEVRSIEIHFNVFGIYTMHMRIFVL